jgi:1,4-alpha-glucan branching enzyme
MKPQATSSRKKAAARSAAPPATTSQAVELNPAIAGCTLLFKAPQAKSVSIAGTFNGWTLQSLEPEAGGGWKAALLLGPGRYEYLFVVDGQWLPDPSATEAVPNPYGGNNSVLTVPPIPTS